MSTSIEYADAHSIHDETDLTLNDTWTLYAHFPTKDRWCYTNDYVVLGTISTIRQFWAYFAHVPAPPATEQAHARRVRARLLLRQKEAVAARVTALVHFLENSNLAKFAK